jgi:hypothetical protein
MPRFYLAVGLFALSLYAWGQYRGIGLFDDYASTTPLRGSTARSAFHK